MAERQTTNPIVWCETMMRGCAKYCYWFPVMGVLFMGSFLLLGYYLDAEALRVIWLTFTGIGILMMICGWLMMGIMMKGFTREGMTIFDCCKEEQNRCC